MAKNGELTREQLEAAARELNEEVVPNPPIDLKAEDEVLKSQIKEAAGIMVPDEDEVTPETQAVIDALEADDTVIPTIDGEPQREPEPAEAEPKEEPKQEKKKEGKEEDLVNLIKAAERIKELKPIVETKEKFKSLRKKMTEGAYRKEGGLEELKQDMLGLLGIGGKKEDGKQTKPKSKPTTPKKPKATKPKREKVPLRANVILDCINSKWITIDELCEKANAKYVELGGKDNIKQTVHIFKTQFSLLAYAGLIIIEGDKVKKA